MSIPYGLFKAKVKNEKLGLAETDLEAIFYGDGTVDLPETPKHRLMNWEVVLSEKEMSSFSFTIEDDTMVLWDSPLFANGTTVTLQFGTEENLAGPFEGVINHRAGWRTLTIGGEFASEIKLSNIQKTQKFLKMKLSDIAKQLFAEEGLAAVVDDTLTVLDVVMRRDETVLQFLRRKSHETGAAYEVYAEGTTGYFVKKKFEAVPELVLRYSTEVTDEDYRTVGDPEFVHDQKNTATEETRRGFDMLNKKPLSSKANNATSKQTSLGTGTYYFDESTGTRKFKPAGAQASAETGKSQPTQKQNQIDADAVTGSAFDKKNAKAYQLRWPINGDAKFVAKKTVVVECPSTSISGPWYIEEARHSGDGGAYNTDLSLIRNALGKAVGTEPATPSGGTNDAKAEEGSQDKVVYVFDEQTGRRVPKKK